MRRNSFRVTLSAANLLVAFLASSSYAAKRSSSGGDGSPITVVIDAGHGGHDRGGIPGQRVAEKDMTLDVARRLRSVLSASGYRVVMTRSSDVFVPLGTRVAIANSYRNAIFVSVHFNSRQDEAAQAASKHTFTVATAYRSRRRFIIMLPAVRRQPIAACVAVVTTSCERRPFRRYSWSAVS